MFNKVTLVGRLGADPELRYTQNSTPVANFSLATDESYTDKDGNRQKKTEWHRIVVWSKQAENASQYLAKGRTALIEGKIQTRQFQDQEGQTRYVTEIIAQNVVFLPSGQGQGQQDSGGTAPGGTDDAGEEVPF